MQHPAHSLVTIYWRRSNRKASARDRRLEEPVAPTSEHRTAAQVGCSNKVLGESATAGRKLAQLSGQDLRVLRVSVVEK